MIAGVYASNTDAAGLAFRPSTDAAIIGNAFVSLPGAAPVGQFQAVSLFHHGDVDFSDNFVTDIQWRWLAVRKLTSPQPQVSVNDDETVTN
jgi:hypothetical protein